LEGTPTRKSIPDKNDTVEELTSANCCIEIYSIGPRGKTMRDLAGFAILVAMMIGLVLLLVGLLSLVVTYCFGLAAFFIAATVLIATGRVHPSHLDWYLKPGVAPVIFLLSIALPLGHGSYLYLDGDHDWWYITLAVNGIPTVVWSLRLLLLHRRQKARYRSEGHDIEDLLEMVRSREAALQVKIDVLQSGFADPRKPEPWELAAGLGPETTDRNTAERFVVRLQALRESYARMVDELAAALHEVQDRAAPHPHPVFLSSKPIAIGMETAYWDAMADAEAALSDALGGAWAGLEERW
jgi:hypothetical protein